MDDTTQDTLPPVTAEEDEAAQALATPPAPAVEPLPEIDPAIAEYIEKRIALFRAELVVCGQIPPTPQG